jgi:hypothetical protein
MTLPAPKRLCDRQLLRFVANQPCLVCGREPCDPHCGKNQYPGIENPPTRTGGGDPTPKGNSDLAATALSWFVDASPIAISNAQERRMNLRQGEINHVTSNHYRAGCVRYLRYRLYFDYFN